MKRNILAIGAMVLLLAVAAAAYLLRPSEEASTPVQAVPIEFTPEGAPVEPADTSTAVPTESEAAAPATDDPQAGPAGVVIYAISQNESTVRFSIDELLRNVPTTAVGVTNQVAGEIAVDFTTPANSQVGQITVNARTLATDNNNRNRMIQNEILDTAEFELITFVPVEVSGLPETIASGEIVSFRITGDLTIRSVTAPVTFEVTAILGNDGALSGYAITTVLRSVYELTIPAVPSVAEVSDEVIVELEFVAYPK